ncbi:MAG: hypothetical protein O7G87_06940 [bacterium]|nr:hypothetical protein [bacterium]
MDALDVRGLPKDKVDYLQQLVDQWKKETAQTTDDTDKAAFTTQKSRVIGPLTRREIYEHL